MNIAFFEIEDWEADYVKKSFGAVQDKFFGAAPLGSTRGRQDIFSFTKEKMNKDNLPQEKDFDVVSVFVGSKVDESVINAFPNLKLITTRSTGFDHLDLKAAEAKGIKIGYVPGYGDNTVAEFAFGLILTLSRKIYEGFDRLRETGRYSFEGLRGFDLKDKTIGIVGTGRIGKFMIKIAHGFGMNVLAYDAYPNDALAKELNFKYVSLDELLANSDVISLHVPYIPSTDPGQGESTHHLINSENIKKIKKGALLINTARGAIVETEALVKALNEGILGGAGLDVLEEEGAIQDERVMLLYGHPEEFNLKTVLQNHVLIDMPNVIITPHNAFNTKEALQRILDTDIENIKSFLEKGEVKHPVPAK